ncbi:hypothetical protein [Prevotella bivia]|uniref:hypothetical protein n=2 Tax=Prevotella bivia TaxID=28125 RepID=UPI0012D2FA3A|nr:hypothetical protein [Prevotella bivia]MDU3909176.1 hypothetical protein [Prevotella bivia]MDU5343157.1 hypothetical protein [Prevotella bivia]
MENFKIKIDSTIPPYRQCWNSNVDDKICYRVRLQGLPKECGEPTQQRTDKKPSGGASCQPM